MPAATGDPARVRLLLVMNVGEGFQLTASPPPPPVPPGGEYVTECFPQRPVAIRDVVVEGFTLVQISAGARTVGCETTDQGSRRTYLLTPPLAASADECARIHLRNDTDAPLQQKNPVLLAPTYDWSDWDRKEFDKELAPWPVKTRVKTYRCKHAVEAMQWKDTDANRAAFATWFEKRGAMFETRGPEVVLPEEGTVVEGEWILFSDDEFIVMDDAMFRDTYVEAT